jgi:predicted DCC family thiol-disulfide oxidoreductase YuxK
VTRGTAAQPWPRRVLLFDGECNLCNATVDWILRHDRRGVFRFATLQSDAAARLLDGTAGADAAADDTVILIEDGRVHTRSTAALRVLHALGPPWSFARILAVVPAPLRDAVYELIARRRHRWFGRRETCRLPTPQERERFLG